jgi:hypothetical protein
VARVKPDVAPAKPKSRKKATAGKKAPKAGQKVKPAEPQAKGSRQGSKTAAVLELLRRPEGATLRRRWLLQLARSMSWRNLL